MCDIVRVTRLLQRTRTRPLVGCFPSWKGKSKPSPGFELTFHETLQTVEVNFRDSTGSHALQDPPERSGVSYRYVAGIGHSSSTGHHATNMAVNTGDDRASSDPLVSSLLESRKLWCTYCECCFFCVLLRYSSCRQCHFADEGFQICSPRILSGVTTNRVFSRPSAWARNTRIQKTMSSPHPLPRTR